MPKTSRIYVGDVFGTMMPMYRVETPKASTNSKYHCRCIKCGAEVDRWIPHLTRPCKSCSMAARRTAKGLPELPEASGTTLSLAVVPEVFPAWPCPTESFPEVPQRADSLPATVLPQSVEVPRRPETAIELALQQTIKPSNPNIPTLEDLFNC